MKTENCNLASLWVERENGSDKREIGYNDKGEQLECPPPTTHPIACVRFPMHVTTSYYKRREDGGYGGSDLIAVGGSSASEELVLAMANGANGQKQHRLRDALVICASSCERCANVLAHQYGLSWGYEEGSDAWLRCGTVCDMCRHDERGQRRGHPSNAPALEESDQSSQTSSSSGETPACLPQAEDVQQLPPPPGFEAVAPDAADSDR
jgi:hypothetical protein